MPPLPSLRVGLVVAVVVIGTAIPSIVDFYTEWLWFGETGYRTVFTRTLTARGLIWAITLLVSFGWLFANFMTALRSLGDRELVIMTTEGPLHIPIGRRRAQPIVGLVALAFAVLASLFMASEWQTWLFFLNGRPFGDADPIFGRDSAFYLFTQPFLDDLRGLGLALAGLALVGCTAIYALSGATGPFTWRRTLETNRAPRRHLALLGAVLLLVLGFGAWLDRTHLLTASSTIIHGATYVDAAARSPALLVLAIASALGAGLAVFGAFSPGLWPIVAAFGLYAGVAIAGAGYATFVQRFIVAPNEQAKETPFIEYNIAGTRRAFALDKVEGRQLSGDAALTRQDIDRNAATLANVRLWDNQQLLDTFGQIQEIRTYYDFISVDHDRYTVHGEERQVMLSARELNSNALPQRNWINERLTFTHGYGLTLGPVNQVTPEGLPVLFIKNLPPESSVDVVVEQPGIYFGELSNDHVFVKTKANEFHYPKGEDNVYTTYEGRGGVPIGGLFGKALFGVKFRSLKTLLSDDISAESRVLFHRRIGERFETIAPFLTYDSDPYLRISRGRLIWVQDAYTVSDRFPYSTPARAGINYIRNSVKATVDAYDGTTTFYLVDPSDPIAQAIDGMFPGLFRPLSEMPEDMRRQLRYPEGIFALQAAIYATYHMTNPAVFYNKEDQWEVPSIETSEQAAPIQPYYTIMKLPGETKPEFIQMLPFTPRRKDNLASWLVARSDGDKYGRLAVFEFPKQKVVYGPRQIVGRINQDQTISPQITLWNQQGSQVIQGTLLVIPIEESLLYIRPLYLRGVGGRIPELKRVIVAYQNQIVMEATLDAALKRLFGGGGESARPDVETQAPSETPAAGPPTTSTPQGSETAATLAAAARDHYQRAMQAQREGDWAKYGEEIKKLGETLERLGTIK